MMMKNTIFNSTQMHLLQMFSYADTDDSIDELKSVLAAYYAQKVQKEADSLWEDGTLGADKIDEILSEHLRTPYSEK